MTPTPAHPPGDTARSPGEPARSPGEPARAGAPLRIAVVLPAPAPYREGLLAALHARGDLELRVVFATAHQPSWDAGADWSPTTHPYPSLHLRSLQLPRPGRTPILWPRGLERALALADPDVVVASEYGALGLRAHTWCRRHGRAHVVLTECTAEIDPLLAPGQLTLHRALARHAAGLIAVSAAGRDRLRAFGVDEDRITVSTQPADLAPIRAAAAAAGRSAEVGGSAEIGGSTGAGVVGGAPGAGGRDGASPGPVVVLGAGRLVPDKNFAGLIDAVARLDPTGERVRLEIAGTGFLGDELRARAARLGVPVRFHGALAPAAMGALYAHADVFALVSTFEPFGVVVREAVAAGLPIVCSERAGAAGEVALRDRNALLVTPESTTAIADALRRLVADPARRASMGAKSHAIDAALDGADVAAFAVALHRAVIARTR